MINIDLTKEQGVNIEFTSNIVYGGEGGKTVDVVQSTGSSKNAVMSQDAVTRELEEAKSYTDEKFNSIDIPKLPELAKVAETGDYNDLENKPTIPDVSGLATELYVQQQIGNINEVLTSIING